MAQDASFRRGEQGDSTPHIHFRYIMFSLQPIIRFYFTYKVQLNLTLCVEAVSVEAVA